MFPLPTKKRKRKKRKEKKNENILDHLCTFVVFVTFMLFQSYFTLPVLDRIISLCHLHLRTLSQQQYSGTYGGVPAGLLSGPTGTPI